MKTKASQVKASKNVTRTNSRKRKTNGENFHVVPRLDGWVVRSEGSSRATSIHSSQREAIDAARKLARKTAAQLVIHGRDGRIRERDSYASDPLPPKGPRRVLYPSSTPSTNREAIRRAVNEAIQEANEGRGLAEKLN